MIEFLNFFQVSKMNVIKKPLRLGGGFNT